MALMNFDGIAPQLFGRDEKCPLKCPEELPPCNCKATETCIIVPRQCNKCAYITCTPDGPAGGGGGVNPGVIAGPIIGVALIAASLVLFWWLRRKKRRDLARLEDLAERARKGESSAFHLSVPGSPTAAVTRSRHASQTVSRSPVPGGTTMQQTQAQRATLPNVPADAEYYDENGATIRVYTGKRGAINADPNHPDNGGNGDPFADSRSMSTAGSGHSTNVIPIHYVPGGQSDDTLAKVLQDHRIDPRVATADQQAAAARTLDMARQNLFRPQNVKMPPPRPARAPDLDLRLNPPLSKGLGQMSDAAASRTSVGSFNSASPSFLSTNTSDVHLDTPKIVTRQQVHVGRLQAAEVVHVSNLRSPVTPPDTAGASVATDPFAVEGETRGSLDSRNFDDDAHPMSQPSPTDLRFSMGSLAFDRASVSTTSTTGRRPPVLPIERHRFESISSSHSAGGESLGNFPMMITPVATTGSLRALGAVPQNMSTATLDMGAGAPGGPPVSRGVLPSHGDPRPLTTASSHSAADSFFGSFPFLPPNINADGSPGVGRTMSSTSEGLGGFEFSFDGQAQDAVDAAGSKEHVEEDPTTPRARTAPRRW